MAREFAEACTGMRYSGPFTLLANPEAAKSLDAYFREDSPMNHLYLRSMLPVLGLAGSMAHAQTTTTAPTDPKKAPATTTTTNKTNAPAAAPVAARQDQFPKASGRSALPA
jgi:hypothetical protein